MIKITIGRKRFKGIYSWDEITLGKFCELAAIPMPEGYEAFVLADGQYDHERKDSVDHYVRIVSELTDKQINDDFPEYYRKVVLCLSDIPEKYLTKDLVLDICDWYFRPFIASVIYNAPVISFMGGLKDYTPESVKHFNIGRERFYLPESITLMGQEIPLAKEPIISFIEANDLFKNISLAKECNKLARLMAIYCRKKNEIYSDDIVLSRQQLFTKVPMSIVWSVFFCIAKQLPNYTLPILLSGTPERLGEARKRARTYRSMAVVD